MKDGIKIIIMGIGLLLILSVISIPTQAIEPIGNRNTKEPQLTIFAPSEVEEKTFFTVFVTDGENPVANVSVTNNWIRMVYYTDENGSVEMQSPTVQNDTWYNIRANKDGYESDRVSILVTNEEEPVICGDASGDGQIDIDDVTFLLSYIFSGGPAPKPLCKGDANSNGIVDIDDLVYIVGYIFEGGPAPLKNCCPQ